MLAQTPLPGTVVDFLTLAFQENCVAIVSLQEDSDKKVGNFESFCRDNKIVLSIIIRTSYLHYLYTNHDLIHTNNLLLFLIQLYLCLQDLGTYYPADNQVLHKGKFTVHSSKVNGSLKQTIQRELTFEFGGVCVS